MSTERERFEKWMWNANSGRTISNDYGDPRVCAAWDAWQAALASAAAPVAQAVEAQKAVDYLWAHAQLYADEHAASIDPLRMHAAIEGAKRRKLKHEVALRQGIRELVERALASTPQAAPTSDAEALQTLAEYVNKSPSGMLPSNVAAAISVAARADEAPVAAEPVEMSPEFTDTARAALLWVLWHHQGGSSKVGQPIRFALGMGAHDRLNDHQISEAKRWGELAASAAPQAPWREAIDEALIVSCLDCTGPNESPKEALARLVQWETQMALDPSISEAAQALVDRGQPEALTPEEVLRAIQSIGKDGHGRIALTYESGPYDIDKPTNVAERLAQAIERAVWAKIKPQSEGEREILSTYEKLHEGKVGAHWLWVVIEQIAAGIPEDQALKEYDYYEKKGQP